jgi:hypothetical protein
MTSPKFQLFAEGYWKTRSVVNGESVLLDFVPIPMASCTKLATAKRLARKLPVVAVVFVDGKVVHEHFPEDKVSVCPDTHQAHGETCFCDDCFH